jgi:transcription initiation factor TFIIF subunit beta
VQQKPPEKPTKAKKMENKTARWAENELIDALVKCFSQYTHWHLKTLKQFIPQPEAFIREGLDKIAVLVRKGPTSNTWRLTDQYARILQDKGMKAPTQETVAPTHAAVGGGSDDEDEDVKMEDVYS